MNSAPGKHKKSAIRILEETVHFLRLAPASLFLYYYLGSLPFVLGVLYFWADMSRSPFAGEHLSIASLGVALLFCWMKIWHTVFGRRIQAELLSVNPQPWTLRRLGATAAMQSLVHATGFIILPLAAVFMFPFGWCYAFYQNIAVQNDLNGANVRQLCRSSWRQAKLWPLQNHILIAAFSLFGLMVLLNLAVVMFLIPYFLKKFTGIDSIFTMSGLHALNTTFIATVLGTTYLCMDPLVKTAYALRCFYGEAIKSGADLKTELSSFATLGKGLATVIVLALLLSPVPTRGSETRDPSAKNHNAFSSRDLDRSINEVLQRREFAWRLPRMDQNEKQTEPSGAIAEVLQWLSNQIRKVFDSLARWIEKLEALLNKLLPKPDPAGSATAGHWRIAVRYLLYAILILLVGVLLYYFFKIVRRRRPSMVAHESNPVVRQPDLTDEGIRADELSVNRWMQLARELMAKGSLRLAMRALYLANLAYLAEKDLVTIEIYKSNRDYEHDLLRRAHEKRDLLAAFAQNGVIFDRVWYGMRKITAGDVDQYLSDQERIMLLAE
jgi:hypothetical protein